MAAAKTTPTLALLLGLLLALSCLAHTSHAARLPPPTPNYPSQPLQLLPGTGSSARRLSQWWTPGRANPFAPIPPGPGCEGAYNSSTANARRRESMVMQGCFIQALEEKEEDKKQAAVAACRARQGSILKAGQDKAEAEKQACLAKQG